MTIRQKLTLTFLLMILLIGLTGFVALHISQKSLHHAIGETSVLLAQETLDKIDHIFYHRIELLLTHCQRAVIQTTLKESNQKFNAMADPQNYINEQEQAWAIPSNNTFVNDLLTNPLSLALKKTQDYFRGQYGFNVWAEIFVTNQYGANIAQTGKTSDYNQADETWWQTAKKDGVFVEDVTYDASANVYSTSIALRINDEQGDFAGILKAVLNIDDAISAIREKENKNLEFSLLTHEGKIIYSTDDSYFFQNIPKHIFTRIQESLRSGSKMYFIANSLPPKKSKHFFAYARSNGYKTFKGLGWILVIKQSTDYAFAPIRYLKINLLIISLITISFALFLSIFISRSISRSINILVDGATRLGNGDLQTKFDSHTKDEIGILADVFNKMASNMNSLLIREKEMSAAEARVEEEMKRADEFVTLNNQLKDNQLKLEKNNQQLKDHEQALLRTQTELKKKISDLEFFQKIMIEREMKMIDLKIEINQLLKEKGSPPKYDEFG